MSFIRYKKFGKLEYAYEVVSKWNKEKKQPYQETKYLGVVVDKAKKQFEKRARTKYTEELILDFGDSFILHKFLDDAKLLELFKKIFGENTDFLLALLSYRLCHGSAMKYSKTWFSGNYANKLYKTNFSSQRISEFLELINDEKLQRSFFKEYIPNFTNAKKGIIIDGSSLPNQIHMPLTTWGLNGEDIDKQIRFHLVVDKESRSPLFFRTLSGNIVDVSTLKYTLDELKKFGVKESFVFVDAGFFSEDNIKEMYSSCMDFLIRLPSMRLIYRELMQNDTFDLESLKYAVRYGKRGLFVKQKEIELFGKNVFAHIVLDPERKGREVKNLILNVDDEKTSHDEKELDSLLKNKGIMILISSFAISKEEVVPTYYVRQTAETLFGFSKDDLGLTPLRVHSDKTLNGFLFMQFLALIVFTLMKKKLGKKYTVEEALLTMRNLKCKVYDNEISIGELTKQQKEITETLKILVPNRAGV